MALRTNSNSALKMILMIASIFIILAGLKTATNLLVPFLLSVFIAIICNPLIARASRYKIPKVVAVLLVMKSLNDYSHRRE